MASSAFTRTLRSRSSGLLRSSSQSTRTLVSEKTLHTSPISPVSPSFYGFQHGSRYSRYLCTSTTKSVNESSSMSNSGAVPSTGPVAEVKSSISGAGLSTEPAVEGKSGNGHGEGGSNNNSQQQQGKNVRGGPVSWMSLFLLLCTGAGLVFYYDREKRRHIEGIHKASTEVRQGPSVGKALIGGPFNLIDHNGKPVTEKSFLGKWNVVYFGFTHCPDICPDELQKLALSIDKIKEKAGLEVVPIFISVDPERDTVEQVGEYIKEFHPKLIGLTGTPEEVKKAAKGYRVYYMKTEEEGSDYLVDHSIVMYLMDPDMEFVKFFGKNEDATSLAEGIIKEIKQYKKVQA